MNYFMPKIDHKQIHHNYKLYLFEENHFCKNRSAQRIYLHHYIYSKASSQINTGATLVSFVWFTFSPIIDREAAIGNFMMLFVCINILPCYTVSNLILGYIVYRAQDNSSENMYHQQINQVRYTIMLNISDFFV